MSIGLQLISSVVTQGNRAALRQLREEHFTPDEVPAWDFLRDYVFRYGSLPTPQAFTENGIRLVAPSGTFEYHMERARTRAIYNAIQSNHQSLLSAIQANQMDEAVDVLNTMLTEAAQVRQAGQMADLREWANRLRDSYQEARLTQEQQGITMGFDPLDRMTGGMLPGDVVAVVARPSVGKTYTLAHMAMAAWAAGNRVLFVSEEMTDQQIALRMVGVHSRTDPTFIRRGQVSHYQWQQIEDTLGVFQDEDRPEFFIAPGSLKHTVRDIDALVQEVGPDVVFIDASYLLRPEGGGRNRARWEMLADVGEGIKAMALARNVPVVHSVQFNRQQRNKGRAQRDDVTSGMDLDNIGGTDVVAQVASIVIGIRAGATPHEQTRRRYALMKNREGGLCNFTTNYLFHPIDFSVIEDDSRDAQWDENAIRQQEQQMRDLSESQM